MAKPVLVFNKEFHDKLKNFKSFIKSYFLDNHKCIQITINPKEDKVKCYFNMGRFIVTFLEQPEQIENFTEEYTFTLDMEIGRQYAEQDANKQLKLYVDDNKQILAYVSGFKFPLPDITPPDKKPMIVYDKKGMSVETTTKFKDFFNIATQKENFITLKDNFMYEKLTENLYHIEKAEFQDTTFAYEDFKMVDTIFAKDEPICYNSIPKWHAFTSKDKEVLIMKYTLDKIDKEPLFRRQNTKKQDILNIVEIDTERLKELLKILVINGNTQFIVQLGDKCFMGGEDNRAYPIVSNSLLHIVNQIFCISKKEISILLKHCDKTSIKFVTGKDFAIIGNKFFLKMKSLRTGGED